MKSIYITILLLFAFVTPVTLNALETSAESEPFALDLREGFTNWVSRLDLPDDQQDPLDRNGPAEITNLEAYAMGINPLTATLADLPKLDSSGSPTEMRFLYRVDTSVQGVALGLESTIELSGESWQPAVPASDVLVEEHHGVQLRAASFAFADASQLFVRIKVQLQE